MVPINFPTGLAIILAVTSLSCNNNCELIDDQGTPALGSAQMKEKLIVRMEGFGVRWKTVNQTNKLIC